MNLVQYGFMLHADWLEGGDPGWHPQTHPLNLLFVRLMYRVRPRLRRLRRLFGVE